MADSTGRARLREAAGPAFARFDPLRMKLVLLFLLMCLLAGVGGAAGSMLGHALGPGGLITGGILVGALFVIGGGFLATRWGWIRIPQRMWTVVGGVVGFVLAVLVALSTLSSPFGPILSTALVGIGAVLGSRIGTSAHEALDS